MGFMISLFQLDKFSLCTALSFLSLLLVIDVNTFKKPVLKTFRCCGSSTWFCLKCRRRRRKCHQSLPTKDVRTENGSGRQPWGLEGNGLYINCVWLTPLESCFYLWYIIQLQIWRLTSNMPQCTIVITTYPLSLEMSVCACVCVSKTFAG